MSRHRAHETRRADLVHQEPTLLPSGSPARVSVVWLAGAGHTALESNWPDLIRIECEEILGALTPRASVEVYVPNQDCVGRVIDARRYADELRDQIIRTTGGQTTYRTDGDFCPPGGIGLREKTLVIKTFLPTVVSDGLRLKFINMFVDFGRRAAQDVVQVEICSRGYWIRTGLLPDVSPTPNERNGEDNLKAG